MKSRTFWTLFLIALILGGVITWIDSSPGWDDTGILVGMVFLSTSVLSFIAPKRAWVWALVVGSGIPLVGLLNSYTSGAIAALIIAIIGATAGALGRKVVSVFQEALS